VATRDRSVHPAVVGVALVLVAANLRTTVASLPPLLALIERDLRLSGAAAGLLTALPVLCMALFAPLAHRFAHRYGREATALGSVLLVAAGNGLRVAGDVAPVYAGTFLAGLGVAACGVVLPGVVKELFHGRPGAATGAYSVAMMLGAAVAASVSVPLERLLGSWPAALGAWGLPALVAAVVWLPVTLRVNEREPAEESGAGRLPWRSRAAWLLAGFLALQSSLAYAYMGWLSPAYESRGWSPAAAGALLGAHNVAQLAAALVLPALADRSTDRRPALAGAVGLTTLGSLWLFALPGVAPWVASTVLGLGLGGGFSLALVLLVDYAAGPAASSRLAAMAFLVCYSAAALAPVLVGALRDLTGGFGSPFGVLSVMAVAQLALVTTLHPRHRGNVT
jgi:MFS transporter, CP family, cyanate transporter